MARTRVKLDSWRFWISVAFAGIVVLFGCVIYLVSVKFSEDADRRTQAALANTTQVTSCITSARSSPQILKLLDFLDVIANNSIAANTAALKAQPTGPLVKVRQDSLRRLKPALPTIKAFRDGTTAGQRTIESCKALAKQLNVDIKPLLKGGSVATRKSGTT